MEILVVDDNKDICLLIENILLSEGYDVESCCTPVEFMDFMKNNKPKLIITDLLMSGFDGRTLTKEIKGNIETEHIKILMMSAHPDAKKLSETAGVDDFITKPFEIDDLLQKVAALLK
ncbi:response regulator [Chryseobacterium sp. MP_3.2]|uniref:response regulator n=1 Tax=Chryseobacterium sp. MP_3.2 TaxID=3071712 RepID=UPI002DF9A301|nr:PleD family two-component response regulator [Chryseobacterium sp. MP_3.2]